MCIDVLGKAYSVKKWGDGIKQILVFKKMCFNVKNILCKCLSCIFMKMIRYV